ncbi:MAG: AraC family transcriptional regulator [Verrucomicrobiota bacterium JB023]|nr:AraC family transcriptional regulator [Verrucomicrobiota bacterium JB023]
MNSIATAASAANSREISKRDDFVSQLAPGQVALELFDHLPDVLFWLKDHESKFIYVNKTYENVIGLGLDELQGRTDLDYFARELASIYIEDDRRVVSSGKSLPKKMELVTRCSGNVEWRATSKIPLTADNGMIIGTAGICRPLHREEGQPLPFHQRETTQLVDYIYDNIEKQLGVEDLASRARMSVSTLERRFRKQFGVTPKRFVLQAKVAAACEQLIATDKTIREISDTLGFAEHSSFTRAFTAIMSISPLKYRKHYKQRVL